MHTHHSFRIVFVFWFLCFVLFNRAYIYDLPVPLSQTEIEKILAMRHGREFELVMNRGDFNLF